MQGIIVSSKNEIIWPLRMLSVRHRATVAGCESLSHGVITVMTSLFQVTFGRLLGFHVQQTFNFVKYAWHGIPPSCPTAAVCTIMA